MHEHVVLRDNLPDLKAASLRVLGEPLKTEEELLQALLGEFRFAVGDQEPAVP